MLPPTAQIATRADVAPAKGNRGGMSRQESLARAARAAARQGGEKVFYNSAKAPRTLLGHLHYCLACPGWNKATDTRVVYSRWELIDAPCGIGYCFVGEGGMTRTRIYPHSHVSNSCSAFVFPVLVPRVRVPISNIWKLVSRAIMIIVRESERLKRASRREVRVRGTLSARASNYPWVAS